jgi:alpha-ketoglutarate-dependent taurine dioxygenase
VLSLYGVEVEPPTAPTTYVSTVRAWETLAPELRARAEAHDVLHAADGFRRGDLTDVFVSSTSNPRSLVAPIGQTHPRTGETMLYVCEQMTKSVVGLEPDESEALLQDLFAHLYDPATEWHQDWRERDLVVWDNLATQHARHANVRTDGPARTLRKVARPVITLSADEVPVYRAGQAG